MARLKSRPLQRTTKRKSQDRDRVLREGLRTSSNKRLRLQGLAERPSSSSKKGKKKKGIVFNLFSVVQKPNIWVFDLSELWNDRAYGGQTMDQVPRICFESLINRLVFLWKDVVKDDLESDK